MQTYNLEQAVKEVYNIMFTPGKGIGVFSSATGQSLAEAIENLVAREETEEEMQERKFKYNLTFTVFPMGEYYRDYCNSVFSSNENLNTKVFQVFLFPYYLESFSVSSFATLSTDGIQAMADYVLMTLEPGHNQFLNIYALRNKVESAEAQNSFLLKEIEKAIDVHYKDVEKLENYLFIDLKQEFLGWTDNFPIRLINYVNSLDDYNIANIDVEDRIKNDLLDIATNASIFAVDLKREE